jgi:AraC family transcriptional regulator of adaptative response / DNA-3-methyladenine glycosylase II
MALRAVLGQHISTAAARTHAGRLAEEHGEAVIDVGGALSRLFPQAASLHSVKLSMPQQRRATFDGLVDALACGRLVLGPGSDRSEALAVLSSLKGVGPWTTHVISMRALGDPDAFPETDLGVRRAAEHLGLAATPAALVERSQPWRPWRSYAVQYLWSVDDHRINQWPPRLTQPTKEECP